MKKLLFVLFGCLFFIGLTSVPAIGHESCTSEKYVCKRCNGTGYENMTKNCPYCNRGKKSGYVDCNRCKAQGVITDRYGDKVKCPSCDGAKRVYMEAKCAYCNGTGEVKMECMSCHGAKYVER